MKKEKKSAYLVLSVLVVVLAVLLAVIGPYYLGKITEDLNASEPVANISEPNLSETTPESIVQEPAPEVPADEPAAVPEVETPEPAVPEPEPAPAKSGDMGIASLPGDISSCQVIDYTPGIYTLDRNLTVNGTCFNVNVSDITMDCQGNTITGNSSGAAFNLTNVDSIVLINCKINNFSYGIIVQNGSRNTIRGNLINGSSSDGLFIRRNSTRNLVDGNHITRNRQGIFINSSSSNNTIQNNIIDYNQLVGIYILNSPNNTLNGNNITSNPQYGIQVDGSSNMAISSNSIAGTANGIYAGNSAYGTLVSNSFASASVGVWLSYSNHTRILGGAFTESGDYGVLSDSSSNLTVYNVSIFDSIDNGVDSGIRFNDGLFCNLTGNSLETRPGGSSGIFVYNSRNCTVASNNIKTSSSGIGLDIRNSNDSVIQYNAVNDSSLGIYLAFSSMRNTLYFNNINNASNEGLEIITSQGNNITFNSLRGANMDLRIVAAVDRDCDNIIQNNTGVFGREILYSNSSASIQNKVLAELVLCNADNSNLVNITVNGSNSNLFLFDRVNNSKITNSTSLNNMIGYYFVESSNNTITNSIVSNPFRAIEFEDASCSRNKFVNVSVTNRGAWYSSDIAYMGSGINGTELIDTKLAGYSISGIVTFEDTQYGKIKFLKAVNGAGTNLSSDVAIRNNSAYVNSSKTGLNVSANVTLYSLPTAFARPAILRDGQICPATVCANQTNLNAGNVAFNVSEWSNYSIAEGWDVQLACGVLNQSDKIYKLTESVYTNFTCFTITATNVTIDCQNWGNKIHYGNSSSSNTYYGVYSNSTSTTVKNCEITMGGLANPTLERYAIYYYESSFGVVQNVNASRNRQGIVMEGTSSYNSIVDNIVSDNEQTGIYLITNGGNNILNNVANNNKFGIRIYQESDFNTIVNNTANNNRYAGFYLGPSASTNNLSYNNATGNLYGILLEYGQYNTLGGNTLVNNSYGISLNDSWQNDVSGNYLDGHGKGMQLWGGSYLNTLGFNTIAHDNGSIGSSGIVVLDGFSNNLSRNQISFFYGGINLTNASGGIIGNNVISNNSNYGITISKGYNHVYNSGFSDCVGTRDPSDSCNSHGIGDCTNYYVFTGWASFYVDCSWSAGLCRPTGSQCRVSENLIVSANRLVNSSNGIVIKNGSNLGVSSNRIDSGNVGISIINSSSNGFTLNNVTGNGDGVRLLGATGNTLSSNRVTGSSVYGIYGDALASGNLIYNNYFDNLMNAIDAGTNNWNTTATLGTSIVGGTYLGGNYWSDYLGVDTSGDYLGDTETPYNSSNRINGGDYLPLAENLCGYATLRNISLSTNLTCNGTAIALGADNLVINCNGHSIIGNGTGYGIYNYGKNAGSVINCNIEGYQYGIYWRSATGGQLLNNSLSRSNYAIDLYQSPNNIIKDNSARNILVAYYFYHSDYNNLTNNKVVNSSYAGIDFYSADNNRILNSTIVNSTTGVSFRLDSDLNLIEGCTIINSSSYGIMMDDLGTISRNNTFRSNVIVNNTVGLNLTTCNGNLIYNNFFDNTFNVQSRGTVNYWNTTYGCSPTTANIVGGNCTGGNYWSNYAGVDNDLDGVGNTLLPYNNSNWITNGGDWLPLIHNHPPVMVEVFVNASSWMNLTNDNLYCWVNATDRDGNDLSYSGNWYKNGALNKSFSTGSYSQGVLVNVSTLDSSYTLPGENWSCNATAFDGTNYSDSMMSGELTIINLIPNMVEAFVNSSLGTNLTTEDLTCWANATDGDGDNLYYSGFWYKDGVQNSSFGAGSYLQGAQVAISTLGSSNTRKGENWSCMVRAYDGYDYSSYLTSGNLTILNSAPYFNPNLVNQTVAENSTLSYNVDCFDADADTVNYYINDSSRFFMSVTSGEMSWTPGFNDAGIYNYEVACADNEVNATQAFTINVTNTNRLPLMGSVVLNSTNGTNTVNENLTCWANATDDDGSALNYSGIWYKNSVQNSSFESNGSYSSGAVAGVSVLENSSLLIGETWRCEVRANDGENYGSYLSSADITIGAVCGNTVCESGEDCSSCSTDCGACSSGGGGGGGGGRHYEIFAPADAELFDGFHHAYYDDDRTKFVFGGQLHYVILESIAKDSVVVTVMSLPMTFTLWVGDTKRIDINDDGVYDLLIRLDDLHYSTSTADLGVWRISESVYPAQVTPAPQPTPEPAPEPTPEPVPEVPTTPSGGVNTSFIIMLTVVIIVVVGLIIVLSMWLARLNREREIVEMGKRWVDDAKRKGYSPKQINQMLHERTWGRKEIKKVMEKK